MNLLGFKATFQVGAVFFAIAATEALAEPPLREVRAIADRIVAVEREWPLTVRGGEDALNFTVTAGWAVRVSELSNIEVDGLHAVMRPDVPIGGYVLHPQLDDEGKIKPRIGCLAADATARIPGEKDGAWKRYNKDAMICLVDADNDNTFDSAFAVDSQSSVRPSIAIKPVRYRQDDSAPLNQTLQYIYLARPGGGGTLTLSVRLKPLRYAIATRDIFLGDQVPRPPLPKSIKIKPGDKVIKLGPISIPIDAPEAIPEIRIGGLGNFVPTTIHASARD